MRVNLFNPGPTRTGMRAMAMPGEDPLKLPTPEQVAAKLVDLCLPSFIETGKIYDFPSGKLQEFRRPAYSMIRKSGNQFSEKIMLHQKVGAPIVSI